MSGLIAVGSENPVKVRAALAAFEAIFPGRPLGAVGVAAPSGVSDQPMTDEETRRGAENRVAYLRDARPDADYWVGIEGGVESHDDRLYAMAWVVIASEVSVGRSRSAAFPLPDEVTRLIAEGIELGEANDRVFAQKDSKRRGGAVGALTGGVIDRAALYEHAGVMALIPLAEANAGFFAGGMP